MKTVIYARVSTQGQDNKRQIDELQIIAAQRNWTVCDIFQEKISGAKKNKERPELIRMLEYIEANGINKVLCWELSRLGRNTIETLTTIDMLTKARISLYIKTFDLETLTSKGESNPMAKLLITILAEVASMEREQVRDRMVSGYNAHIKKGGKVGRFKGYKKPVKSFTDQHQDVIKLLKQELSVRQIMKITGKSSGTIQKAKRIIE